MDNVPDKLCVKRIITMSNAHDREKDDESLINTVCTESFSVSQSHQYSNNLLRSVGKYKRLSLSSNYRILTCELNSNLTFSDDFFYFLEKLNFLCSHFSSINV